MATALLALGSCGDEVTTVPVARVEISPPNPSVRVAETTLLTARVLGNGGEQLSGRPIEWRSLNTGIATVDGSGMVRGVAAGSTRIEAVSAGVTGTADVSVTAGPTIVLNPAEVEFTAVRNGATPGDRTVSVQNGGEGQLTGLTSSVRFTAGEPTGWLSATVGTTAPTSLVLSANQGTLAPGTYTATVEVASPTAANSPATLTARLMVQPPQPAIGLGAASLAFAAAVGGADPAEQTVAVTNAGGGALSGLAAAVAYGDGQPTGWLTANLSATTAPATIAVRAATTSLAAGTYTATVQVTSAVAQNSPQQIAVTLTIGSSQPAIAVAPNNLTFAGARNGASPPTQTVQITNVGGGTLGELVTSVTFPGGQPTGWLSVALSGTSAPATLTVGAHPGTLDVGTYTATISVASPNAVNSPRQIGVSFTVAEPPPIIVAAPPSVAFTVTSTGADPAPVAVAETNGGAGSLTGLAHTISYPANTAEQWLSAQLSGPDAPATLTLTASRGTLPVGTYSATVRLTGTGAAPLDIPVQYTIANNPPAAPTGVIATALAHDAIEVVWTDASDNESGFEVERSTDGGATWPSQVQVTANTTRLVDAALTPSTTYVYRVRACNASGCSSFGVSGPATTAPAPPSGLTATAVSAGRIDLIWTDEAVDEDQFAVERSTDGFTWVAAGTAPANATSFSDTNLAAGTTYHYRLRACRSGLCSGPGNGASATTPNPPAAPSGLTAAAAAANRIDLSWIDNSTNETEFRIESRATGGTFAQVGTTGANQTSFSHTNLTQNTTYEYRVRACTAVECSAYSAVATATTPPAAPPGAPTSLQATAAGTSAIDLSWSASSGVVVEYRIERSTSASGSYSQIATTAAGQTTYQDSGLQSGTTYFYRVRAGNAAGLSSFSPVASATTDYVVPGAPTGLAATAASASQINLAWSAGSGVSTRFRIWRRVGAGSSLALHDSVGGNVLTYQDGGLSEFTEYGYAVQGCNPAGCSPLSAEATATTPPANAPNAPTSLQASAVNANRIDLSWASGGGVVNEYRIESSLSPTGSFTEIGTRPPGQTSFSHTGLTPNTTYYYRVRARNSVGFSGYSAVVSATTPQIAPGTPTLQATAVSSNQINLSWSPGAGGTVDGYRILRRTALTSFIQLDSVSGSTTSRSDNGVLPGVEYTYRVEACNSVGCQASGDAQATPPIAAAPTAPTSLDATAGGDSIRLAWSGATGIISEYRIERSLTGGAGDFSEIASVGTGITTFVDRGLQAGTTYHYRVRAWNVVGSSAPSPIASATTAPASPQQVTATATASDAVSVTWTASAGTVTEYRVERALDPAGTWTEIAQVTAAQTSYNDTGLQPSTTYYYRVRAGNGSSLSAPSVEDSARTLDPALLPPTGLAASGTSASSIGLSWSHTGQSATTFEIGRAPPDDPGTFSPLATVPGTARNYSDSPLPASTQYHYRIRACGGGTCTAWSTASGTTQAPSGGSVPAMPALSSADPVSPTEVQLAWSSPGGQTHFDVQRRSGTSGMYQGIATVPGYRTSHSDTSPAAGSTYQYRVRACALSNCSQYSPAQTVTTPTSNPIAPAAAAPGDRR